MGNTLAIHWAATTRGTWLHGDPRGSWRGGRLIGPDPYLEAESRARMSHDAILLDMVERAMIAEEFGAIVREQRHRIFAATVQASHVHLIFAPLREDIKIVIARMKRRSAAAVLEHRRNLIGAGIPIETAGIYHRPAETAGLYSRPILGRSRQRCSANRQQAGRDGRAISNTGQDGPAILVPRSLWTGGKFPIYIFDEQHLMSAIEYVRDHNRRVGIPPDPFAWIEPLFPTGAMAGERFYRSSVCEEPRF